MVGGGTRLHADNTGRQRFEKCFHASTAELPAQHRSPGLVDRMDLKYVLSEIKTNDNKRHLDSPPECGVTTERTLRHSMPVGGRPHHHFGCTCYHPLFVFNQLGDLERSALRPGNVHSADGWREV
jgi:hypothetical protein